MPSCSSSSARQVKQVGHDMAAHVSSSGLRLGGASDDAVSSFNPGRSSPFQHFGYVEVPPHSGRKVSISPDRFFYFTPVLEVHPFIADRLRAALFVTFSASLQPLSFEIIALHRNFFSNHFCAHSRCLCLYVATNGYTRDNGPSVARPPECRYPNQACQPLARQKHPSCTRNIRRLEPTP